jgi:hypothetical protein
MNKRTFNIIGGIALIIGLLYVPTKTCNAYLCITAGWDWFFSITRNNFVDLNRLVLQILIIGLGLFILWNTDIEK